PIAERPLVYRILECFARAKLRHSRRADLDTRPGARIASTAGGALAHVEGSESHQRDGLPLLQRRLDGGNRTIQGTAGGRLGDVGRYGYRIDEFLLVHETPPLLLSCKGRAWPGIDRRRATASLNTERALVMSARGRNRELPEC